jgi:hypothetical protein
MQAKPYLPEFQRQPPPGTPPAAPDLSDMDRIHRMVAGNHLADAFLRLAGKVKS